MIHPRLRNHHLQTQKYNYMIDAFSSLKNRITFFVAGWPGSAHDHVYWLITLVEHSNKFPLPLNLKYTLFVLKPIYVQNSCIHCWTIFLYIQRNIILLMRVIPTERPFYRSLQTTKVPTTELSCVFSCRLKKIQASHSIVITQNEKTIFYFKLPIQRTKGLLSYYK